VIGGALLAGLPLVILDQELLGFRRYVWLGASIAGLFNLALVDPTSWISGEIDKVCLALLSVSLVPHFVRFVKDQQWMALGVIPPFIMVIHTSMSTTIDAENIEQYWQVRAFLHVFSYILPYLNHLPSSTEPTGQVASEGNIGVTTTTVTHDGTEPEKKTSDVSRNTKRTKAKTNKKKR
jgi:hypothetical protein